VASDRYSAGSCCARRKTADPRGDVMEISLRSSLGGEVTGDASVAFFDLSSAG